jgi:uncharacterized membrane protein
VGLVLTVIQAHGLPTSARNSVPEGPEEFVAADLGDLGGGYGLASAINDAGIIVGSTAIPPFPGMLCDLRATLWTQARTIINVDVAGGVDCGSAEDISNSGRVSVASTNAPDALGVQHAFSWTRENGLKDLTPGSMSAFPFGINNRGDVVGSLERLLPGGDVERRAMLWAKDGTAQDLGSLGGCCSEGRDINDNGEVTGHSGNIAYVWNAHEGMKALPFPEGAGWQASGGIAINNVGDVLGFVQGEQGTLYLIWTKHDGMVPVVGLGETEFAANAINDRRWVVGHRASGGTIRPFLWTPSGGFIDLPLLPDGVDGNAFGINNHGEVVGMVSTMNSERPVIWAWQGR